MNRINEKRQKKRTTDWFTNVDDPASDVKCVTKAMDKQTTGRHRFITFVIFLMTSIIKLSKILLGKRINEFGSMMICTYLSVVIYFGVSWKTMLPVLSISIIQLDSVRWWKDEWQKMTTVDCYQQTRAHMFIKHNCKTIAIAIHLLFACHFTHCFQKYYKIIIRCANVASS